ncbi:MAG: UDP-2,3-diacylglucosamine diphosphatase [Gammaproteobacteria bacterium]|nr:UDP-2,3-diacylglucosamine diphosphatase [Gammaproteobacteria bacterium]
MMQVLGQTEHVYCETLWISDIHLGTRHCRADYLLEVLSRVHCKRLYLVGDIVDVWSMQRRVYWPESHNQVVRDLLGISGTETEVIYIPGNHDMNMREFVGTSVGAVAIEREYVHETRDGRRFLVIHGDELDFATRYRRLNRWLGDAAYSFVMWANTLYNRIGAVCGKPYWSLASWLKTHVSEAARAIEAFQGAAVRTAANRGMDGIICGHLHHPAIMRYGDVLYCNDGDWVENCTALIEDRSGQLRLIQVTAASLEMTDLRVAA